MRTRLIALTASLVACRGEPAPSAEPPAARQPAAERPRAMPKTEPEPQPEPQPEPELPTERSGPALEPSAVLASFRAHWAAWSADALASHPLRDNLAALLTKDVAPKREPCASVGTAVATLLGADSPELLVGEPTALSARPGECWTLHFDGMMGPGLGVALALDGTVLLAWVILEG